MRYFTAALLCVLAYALAAPAAAETAREQLHAYIDGFSSLEADFHQELSDESGMLIEASQGKVYLQRPDRFRWDYAEPFQQSIISDGKDIYIYDEDLAQVTIKPLANNMGGTPAALLSGNADLEAEFDIEAMEPEDDLHWLALYPHDADEDYHAIELGFDDGGLRIMRLRDNLGQVTSIAFANEQRDKDLAASIFEFTPPADVDVIRAEP